MGNWLQVDQEEPTHSQEVLDCSPRTRRHWGVWMPNYQHDQVRHNSDGRGLAHKELCFWHPRLLDAIANAGPTRTRGVACAGARARVRACAGRGGRDLDGWCQVAQAARARVSPLSEPHTTHPPGRGGRHKQRARANRASGVRRVNTAPGCRGGQSGRGGAAGGGPGAPLPRSEPPP